MEDRGFALSYRRLWSHPIFRNKQEAAVFAWMIDMAQWQPATIRTKFGPIELQRGELIIAEREIAADFGIHRNTLRALLQRMFDDGMIAAIRDRIPHRAGTVIRVTNYHAYQTLSHASDEPQDRKKTESRTEEGPKEDRSGTKNKEDNTGSSPRSVARERAELKADILRELGLFDHASWRGDASRIDMWLSRGFDPWLDIVPCIAGRLPAMHDPPPLKYWDKPIAEYHAARIALPTAGTPPNGSSRGTVPPRGNYEANRARNLQGAFDALADELGSAGAGSEPH